MPTEYIDCVLASGFFDNELYVIVGDSSAIVSRQDVKVTREPHDQKDGQGQVCVYIIERKADRLLVEIPGQPVVGGLRTWVQGHSSAVA
jgi:hypothetical protein